MKKFIILGAIFLAIGCSTDDCADEKAQEKAMYEGMLDRDGLTPEQRRSLEAQMKRDLEKYPC